LKDDAKVAAAKAASEEARLERWIEEQRALLKKENPELTKGFL